MIDTAFNLREFDILSSLLSDSISQAEKEVGTADTASRKLELNTKIDKWKQMLNKINIHVQLLKRDKKTVSVLKPFR